MKIIDKRKELIPFGELKPTSIFEICGNKYMKVNGSYDIEHFGTINSINIENGEFEYFDKNILVTPFRAEITLYINYCG